MTDYRPCLACGVPVEQPPSGRARNCCCHRHANLVWRRLHPNVRGATTLSSTITYTDASGAMVTRVGYGLTKGEARADARAQVPPSFVPVAEYLSTPRTILASLARSADA